MADISVEHKHGLTLEEAQEKVTHIVDDIKSEFSSLVSDIDWNDDRTHAKVKGKGFSGDFHVNEEKVGIDINLKLFAKPFKGKVEEKVKERIEQYFG